MFSAAQMHANLSSPEQHGVDEPIPTPSNLPWFDLLAHPAA